MSIKHRIGVWLAAVAGVVAVVQTVSAATLPNLVPYQPTGWSDKIVVATTNGATSDGPVLTTLDNLYFSWAVRNTGPVSTGAGFDIDLYVDGFYWTTFVLGGALPAGSYTYSIGDYFGPLAAGPHTVEIIADSTGVITESNEGDNTYTKNFTVNVPVLPNLAPYQPGGWSDKVVVSKTPGSVTDSASLTTADTLYVDWAVINNGNTATTNLYYVALYLDSVFVNSWFSSPPQAENNYVDVTDYSIGSLAAGSHTLELIADSTGLVTESDESDNTYFKFITVNPVPLAAPTLNTPTNTSTALSTTPAFSWSSVAGATGYRILVATNLAGLPTDPAATAIGSNLVINATTSSAIFTPTIPLNGGMTYYWEVHATNASQPGTWSSVYHFATAPVTGVTIIPTWDSTITSDPQAATIMATINSAIAVYQSAYSDPVTVTITFKEVGTGLGASSKFFQTISYTSYRAALVSHATTADDTTALAHLPAGPDNPVTGDANVNLANANARALGFSADSPGGMDATISLKTSIMNLSSDQTDPSKYSLFATVSHEIDECLGFGSSLNNLTNNAPIPTGAVWPEDLFRYTQSMNGTRSFNTTLSSQAWFSIDGTANLARFNQEQGGDFADWYSPGGQTPEVQDAFATPGAFPVLGVELRGLDVIGYTRVVPTITIIASAGTGGTISPNGSFSKNPGDSQMFTATPNSGVTVNQWLLDGALAQTGGTTYTLSNIQASHTVQVTFNLPPPTFGTNIIANGKFMSTLSGLSSGETVVLYSSTNLTTTNWVPILTNVAGGATLTVSNMINPAVSNQYFRATVH